VGDASAEGNDYLDSNSYIDYDGTFTFAEGFGNVTSKSGDTGSTANAYSNATSSDSVGGQPAYSASAANANSAAISGDGGSDQDYGVGFGIGAAVNN
jgi:hypothetical protein